MPIPVIPSLIERVYLSPMASPSLLANERQCAMCTFGREESSRGFIPDLIKGPAIEIGLLIHSAIEIADGKVNLIEIFEQLKDNRQSELQSDERRKHYSDLEKSVGDLKWAERMSLLRAHVGSGEAAVLPQTPQATISIKNENVVRAKELIWPSINLEVPLRSSALGLSGRADRIELKLPRNVLVTDVKTGAITDEDGNPRPEYVLQLAAYEALAMETWPGAEVKLFLEAGHQLEVVITDSTRQELGDRLNSLRALVQSFSESVVAAASAQSTGVHCLECPVRHVCVSYREIMEADTFLEVFGGEFARNVSDGFGTVIKKQFKVGHHVVNLRTSKNRIVQLKSRHEWQVAELGIGEGVYFFSFDGKANTNRMSSNGGLPSNFSDDFFSGRDWSAEIFRTNNVNNAGTAEIMDEHG